MRRGVVSISFGMLFSIIMIVAIIGVGVYAIIYFLDLGKCTDVALFFGDLQEAVDQAWVSEITDREFVGSLPGEIESVCIGDLNVGGTGQEYNTLRRYRNQDSNVFLYPPGQACDQSNTNIDHIDFTELAGFTCFPNENGKVNFRLEKGSFDSLVKIKRS